MSVFEWKAGEVGKMTSNVIYCIFIFMFSHFSFLLSVKHACSIISHLVFGMAFPFFTGGHIDLAFCFKYFF